MKKKNKEIQRLEYWIENSKTVRNGYQNIYDGIMITTDDAFALYSEKGIETKPELITNYKRYKQLKEAKCWEGIHVGMWEEAVLDGSIPYWTLLGGEDKKEIMPRVIVDFMKKQMFQGKHADIIEDVYQRVLKYHQEKKIIKQTLWQRIISWLRK